MDGDEKTKTPSPFERHFGKVTSYPDDPDGVSQEIEGIRHMLAANPESLDLKEWLAVKLYTANQLDEAIPLFEELVQAGHNLVSQHYYLGNAWYKKNEPMKAIASWQYVAREIPDDVKGMKAAARLQKALEELNTSEQS